MDPYGETVKTMVSYFRLIPNMEVKYRQVQDKPETWHIELMCRGVFLLVQYLPVQHQFNVTDFSRMNPDESMLLKHKPHQVFHTPLMAMARVLKYLQDNYVLESNT
jgi:hypothetical protein